MKPTAAPPANSLSSFMAQKLTPEELKAQAKEKRRPHYTKYNRSAKRLECARRWNRSEKGLAASRRYRATVAGRIVRFLNNQRPERKMANLLREAARRERGY
jgi:hypothetical protein